VEKFFLEISTVPALASRLKTIVYKLNFPVKLSELKPVSRTTLTSSDLLQDIQKIKDASKEVNKSKKFLKVVEVVLYIGNFLNGGGAGMALGFRLSTLLKLVDTKTLDNKSSLLHYLINTLREKYKDEDVASFTTEIQSIKGAKAGTRF
jgi:hypothetical protein